MYIISNTDNDDIMLVESLKDANEIVRASSKVLVVYETDMHRWINISPQGSLVPLFVTGGITLLLMAFIGRVKR